MEGRPWKSAGPWVQALGITMCATALAFGLKELDGTLHLPFFFLAASVVASALLGRGPGVLAATVGTFLLDWLFVPPYHSLRVSVEDLFSLTLMLSIALSIGHLADRLRREATRAREGEQRAQTTSRLARELTGSVTLSQVESDAREWISSAFGCEVEISSDPAAPVPTGWCSFPLRAPRRNRGLLLVGRSVLSAGERELAETLASLVGLAIERVHFVELAREATVRMEGERLRSGILATLSHDLRTPLTGILAGTEALISRPGHDPDPDMDARIREVADEARRMADLVENLLHLSRLQSGGVTLRNDWNSQVELASSALRQRAKALGDRRLDIDIPDDAPLVWCDGILVERVLVNLLDNAVRHTPPGSPLRLWSESVAGSVRIGLDDHGYGFPPEQETAMSGGVGLQLCRTIAQVHGGTLETGTAPGGGARVALRLPQDRLPPEPPKEEST